MYLEQLIEKYQDWLEHSEGLEHAVVEEALEDLLELERVSKW